MGIGPEHRVDKDESESGYDETTPSNKNTTSEDPTDIRKETETEVIARNRLEPQSSGSESESEEEEDDTCVFHRSQYIGICGEDCLEMHAQEPWPQDVKLFQPYEVEQILLPDNANCLAVQAYLKMCGLAFEVEPRHNAEYMSPSGRVPFIKCGAFVVSELDPIIGFISTKGISLSDKMDPSQKADMRAYMSLVNTVLANAEQYVTWVDAATLREVTKPRHGSVYPWPLNHFINWQKASQVKRKLSVLGWYQKSLDEVYREVENCCNALSERLEKKEFFFGSSPTELDCAVYGHLYAILTHDDTEACRDLGNVIRNYDDLMSLVAKIDLSCFGRCTLLSVDEPPPKQEAPPSTPKQEAPPSTPEQEAPPPTPEQEALPPPPKQEAPPPKPAQQLVENNSSDFGDSTHLSADKLSLPNLKPAPQFDEFDFKPPTAEPKKMDEMD